MPKRNAAQKAARAAQQTTPGTGYQSALNRARATTPPPASPAPEPAPVSEPAPAPIKAPKVHTYGPRQFPDALGLTEWEFERAQRIGAVPSPDVAGRWSEDALTATAARMSEIREQIGTMPDVGARRAEEHLSQRFGITVVPGTAAELSRRGHLPVRDYYKGHALYCGVTLERFKDRRKVVRASAAGRLYMRDEAARALNLRPTDFAHLVRAGLLAPATTVLSSVPPRVVVPLYRQADMDRAVRSRRVDWDAVRATPPGRPSPLAKLPDAKR
ncbi:hypothetical protein [Streptomyces parvulus]